MNTHRPRSRPTRPPQRAALDHDADGHHRHQGGKKQSGNEDGLHAAFKCSRLFCDAQTLVWCAQSESAPSMPPGSSPGFSPGSSSGFSQGFSIDLAVRDYECDLQGVVNNAVYFNYLEHARHAF